jgi:hypothetical protein
MSPSRRSRRSERGPAASGLPRSTDICTPTQLVRYVPEADVTSQHFVRANQIGWHSETMGLRPMRGQVPPGHAVNGMPVFFEMSRGSSTTMINSNLVGVCTGRSAGFSPRRITALFDHPQRHDLKPAPTEPANWRRLFLLMGPSERTYDEVASTKMMIERTEHARRSKWCSDRALQCVFRC